MGLRGWLSGGGDEIGWDDLVAAVVDELARMVHYGRKGRAVFPVHVDVDIQVPDGSVEVARGFVIQADFDRAVAAALANRCNCDPIDLPTREYQVAAGRKLAIGAREGGAHDWELVVDGGDQDGRRLTLAPGQDEFAMGRGPWHGADQQVRNDLPVCEQTEFVSRRAARVYRRGNCLEIEALDQADCLLVHRAGGEVIRPARTASGRVAVRPGDVIELTDGKQQRIRVLVGRA